MTLTTDMGSVLRPGDPEYDQARKVWNGAIDRYPAIIVRCHTADEVAAAVKMATASGLEIAVRGGGHSIPGLSVCEGGLMIDVSPMKGLEVDPVGHVARAEPGLLWGEYDGGTQAYGLASPGGEISHTGVAGLTLGGGIGWLSRRHGLACDNLVGAQVVLADGSVLEADDAEQPELMWGLRGGGGNFGIVTEFRFRVHPVPALLAGLLVWPAAEAAAVADRFLSAVAEAPRDLSLVLAQLVAPPDPQFPADLQLEAVVGIAALWTGEPEEGEEVMRPLRSGAWLDTIGVYDYVDIQRWLDDGVPHGRSYHVRSEWLGDVDAAAVGELIAAAAESPSPFNQVLLRHLGGAIADVAPDATAFRYRDAVHMLTVAAGWEDVGAADANVAWCRQTWDRVQPWSSGGGYVNHLAGDEGADRVRAAYGPETWTRLVTLKRAFDPNNVFHLNQNIPPT